MKAWRGIGRLTIAAVLGLLLEAAHQVRRARSVRVRSGDVIRGILFCFAASGCLAAQAPTNAAPQPAPADAGITLPTFLRTPPPVFAVVRSKQRSIHVVAFGDFGTGAETQRETAAAMRTAHHRRPFDFGLTLGDNFYPDGMRSPTDGRWQRDFEAVYGLMRIRIYATLGNHDWYRDSPAAEILHTAHSAVWRMPAEYYTFTAGPAQFFALNTNALSAVQLAWLAAALDASTARWKVVYGHYPPYVASKVADDRPELVGTLLPTLRGRADVYLSGHNHSMQHLKPAQGVNLFISGAGGAGTYPVDSADPKGLFVSDEYGFATLDATYSTFTVRFIDRHGKELYVTTLRTPGR